MRVLSTQAYTVTLCVSDLYSNSKKVLDFHFQNESNSASNPSVDLEIFLKWVLAFQFDVFLKEMYCTESIYNIFFFLMFCCPCLLVQS